MKDALRLFVAAKLPEKVTAYLQEARQVYQDPNIRFVPEQNLHLTLYFLGNVPAIQDVYIRQTVAQVAQRHGSFTLVLERLEPGPKPKSPRLVWACFREHEAFTHISQDLTKALAPTPPKQEKFIPHVTVCRFRKEGGPMPTFQNVTPPEEITFPVSSIALWQSQLASLHPIYSVVQEFPLGS